MNSDSTTQPPPQIPIEFSGKWIAWDRDHSEIIASAETFAEVRRAALATGESDPSFDKVPAADVRFVGGSSL